MTPQEALDKVNKCLAVARSAGEKESDTSLKIAGRMILKHGLVVGLPGTASATSHDSPEPGPTGPAGGAAPGTAPPRATKARSRTPRTGGTRPPPGHFYAMATHDSVCTQCHRPVLKGNPVIVGEGGFSAGATHVRCGDAA